MATLLPGTEDWEATWAKGLDRGMRWDIGKPEPELTYELGLKDKGTLAALFTKDPSEIRALVPGCGRGYAVAALANAGFNTIGLDLSESAAKVAETDSSHPNAKYLVGNFFEVKGLGPFDIIFDSTFLCAISPLQWRDWARRMNELVARGGYLALQAFPISVDDHAPERDPDHPGDEPGPPNRLTVKLVRELLKPYPFVEVAFRLTPPERFARGDFFVRGEPVREYWMVFQRK